jgi:hypothetical protein
MKALVGPWEHRPYRLLAEITALRARVTELERSLAQARDENLELRQLLSESEEKEIALTS